MMKSMPRLLISTMIAGLLLFTSACKEKQDNLQLGSIKITDGANQSALPGHEFENEVFLELMSKPGTSLLGGKAKPDPVPNRKVNIVQDQNGDLEILNPKLVSDAGGVVSFKVKAGKTIGDKYLRIIPEGSDIRQEIRFIVGAEIHGTNQEGHAGKALEKPLSVKLVNQDGTPAKGVPVYFSVSDSPERKNTASVSPKTVKTDADGIAKTEIKLGKDTGKYTFGVEVADPEQNYFIRNHKIQIIGSGNRAGISMVIGS